MAIFDDFCKFANLHVTSGDVDPMYPVLRNVYEWDRLSPEIKLWRTLLYVTWYHVGTAEFMWTGIPAPRLVHPDEVEGLATGIERRGFRGNTKAANFINDALNLNLFGKKGLLGWLEFKGPLGWRYARQAFEGLRGAGPWASYKWADLLLNVVGVPILADEIGIGGGGKTAGPIPGLAYVTGEPLNECIWDPNVWRTLFNQCLMLGVPFQGVDQLETSLCDFNSLVKGRYYVGHDIDMQMEQLKGCHNKFWEARARSFEPKWLGEIGGWNGVRKSLKTTYRDKGVIWEPT